MIEAVLAIPSSVWHIAVLLSPLLLLAILYKLFRRAFQKTLARLWGSVFITTFLSPLLAALPPYLIALSSDKSPYLPQWLSGALQDWFKGHPLVTGVAMLWPPFLIILTYSGTWVKRRIVDADKITAKEYGLILRTLDNVTGHRMVRLGKFAERLEKPTAGAVPISEFFTAVVSPEDQISELLRSIHHVFLLELDLADEETGGLAVSLARMEKNRFEEFFRWLPESQKPRSSKDELRARECCLTLAAESKRIVIVENIAKEIAKPKERRRYAPGAPGSGIDGSLIAFPVVEQSARNVPFVVSLRSDKPKQFRHYRKSRYQLLLQPFATRLAIEHSLLVIKNHHERYSGPRN